MLNLKKVSGKNKQLDFRDINQELLAVQKKKGPEEKNIVGQIGAVIITSSGIIDIGMIP